MSILYFLTKKVDIIANVLYILQQKLIVNIGYENGFLVLNIDKDKINV